MSLLLSNTRLLESMGLVSLLDGLIAYFKCEDVANPMASEVNGGSVTGANFAYNPQPGIKDNCFQLDNAAGYVNSLELYGIVPFIDTISDPNRVDYSINMWFKTFDFIQEFGLVMPDYFGSFNVGGDTFGRILLNAGTIDYATAFIKTVPGIVQANQWHMLTIVSSGTNSPPKAFEIYLDNFKRGATRGLAFSNTMGVFNIGISDNNSTAPRQYQALNGQVDELMFWNRRIRRSEIRALWENGAGKFYDDF